jgi:hypothetical protein
MRGEGVTIRALARRLDVPMVRVRQVRAAGVSGLAACDWYEAICGELTDDMRSVIHAYAGK